MNHANSGSRLLNTHFVPGTVSNAFMDSLSYCSQWPHAGVELFLLLYVRKRGALEKLSNLICTKSHQLTGRGAKSEYGQLDPEQALLPPPLTRGHVAMSPVPWWPSCLDVPSWDMSLSSCWGRIPVRSSLKTIEWYLPLQSGLCRKMEIKAHLQNPRLCIYSYIWDTDIVCTAQPGGYSSISQNCFPQRCVGPQAFFLIFPSTKPVNL